MRDRLRFVFVAILPFFVLGPIGINPAKVVYGVSVFSFATYILFKENWVSTKFRNVYICGILLGNLVIYGVVVGLVRANSFESLGSAFNLLLPALWLITIPYAANSVSEKFLLDTIFILGLIASVISVNKWATLRGYFNFSIEVNALDSDWSIYLILIVFLTQFQKFGKVRRRVYLGILLFSMLFSIGTGTRTLLFIYTYIMILSLLVAGKQSLKVASFILTFFVTFFTILPFLPDVLQRRYQNFLTQFSSLGLIDYLIGFDESTNLRARQREYFKSVWLENELLGTGIGQTKADSIVIADTPYAFLAQFGSLGAIYLLFVLLFLFKTTYRTIQKNNLKVASTIVLFFLCLLPVTLAYNWTLHKSFWISLSWLIAYISKNNKLNQKAEEHKP